MAGVTSSSSPLHEKMCVAGTTILGGAIGAVGTGGNLIGLLGGAAVGFILGTLICSRDVISGPLRNYLDFQVAINQVGADPSLQEKIVSKMIDAKIASNRDSGLIILKFVLDQAANDPKKYFGLTQDQMPGPPTSSAAHGLSMLGRSAEGASRTLPS